MRSCRIHIINSSIAGTHVWYQSRLRQCAFSGLLQVLCLGFWFRSQGRSKEAHFAYRWQRGLDQAWLPKLQLSETSDWFHFYSILFCSVLFYYILLFCIRLFYIISYYIIQGFPYACFLIVHALCIYACLLHCSGSLDAHTCSSILFSSPHAGLWLSPV